MIATDKQYSETGYGDYFQADGANKTVNYYSFEANRIRYTYTRITFVLSKETFLGKMKWLITDVIDTEIQSN